MTDQIFDYRAAPTTPDGAPAQPGITLYGASWCGDTRRSRALLDHLGLPYTDVDVDQDPAANAWVIAQRGGERRIPTIVLHPDAPILFEPSDDDLRAALVRTGYLAPAQAEASLAAD